MSSPWPYRSDLRGRSSRLPARLRGGLVILRGPPYGARGGPTARNGVRGSLGIPRRAVPEPRPLLAEPRVPPQLRPAAGRAAFAPVDLGRADLGAGRADRLVRGLRQGPQRLGA